MAVWCTCLCHRTANLPFVSVLTDDPVESVIACGACAVLHGLQPIPPSEIDYEPPTWTPDEGEGAE